MSEKKETIEDRRKKVVEDLAYIHDWSEEPDKRRIDGALTLLSDLMTEREKLKERIDRGKQSLSELAIDLQFADNEVKTKAQIVDVCTKALDALTALEARVEELEKERDMNRLDYLEAIYERDAEFCVPEMYAERKDLRQKRKEAAQRAHEALSRKEEQAPTKEKDLTTPQERAIVKNKGEQGG